MVSLAADHPLRSLRKPSCAMISRRCIAMNLMKFTACSGLPANFSRRRGSWVATGPDRYSGGRRHLTTQPTATQRRRSRSRTPRRPATRRWQRRAPSSAARPSRRRSWKRRLLMDQSLVRLGEAELPRAGPHASTRSAVMRRCPHRGPRSSTTSACALATPAAIVPTPTSATSFTEMRASRLAFLRSWMNSARSSIE